MLLLCRFFPPLFDVGGKRPYHFARYLPAHGWRVTVLTDPLPAGRSIDPTPFDLPADVRVERDYVPRWWREPRRGLSDGTREAPIPLAPEGHVRHWRSGRGIMPVGRRVLLSPRLAARARRLAAAGSVDLIFATGPPWPVLVNGLAASVATGAPLCLDLRDPWSLNFLQRERGGWVRAIERRVERTLLRRAQRVIFTSEAAAEAYRRLYPELPPTRLVTIRNSFDPARRPPPIPPAGDVTLMHFGNCYGPRRLAPVLRAAAEVRRRGMIASLRLINLGRVSQADLDLATQIGVRDWLEFRPAVPYAEGLRWLTGVDLQVLLAFGDETLHVPAKLFDYLLSGAPILCVAPPSETTQLVEQTGAGRCAAPEDIAGIARIIEAAVAARHGGAPVSRRDPAVIEQFSAPRAAARLAELFDEVLAESRGIAGRQ